MTLQVRGVNYDTGVQQGVNGWSREVWRHEDVARDMRAIRQDLHCNSVSIYGSDSERLVTAAEIALREGLHVTLQPRLYDGTKAEVLNFVAECAREVEKMRNGGNITLSIGCELSLFTRGFMPGRSFSTRMMALSLLRPLLPWINKRLNAYLRQLLAIAREQFHGKIFYAAGEWERIEWEGFDYIGVNKFRNPANDEQYRQEMRQLVATGKPVIVTEFGCCTFEGAEDMGVLGFRIVNYFKYPPEIPEKYKRSESAQAQLLNESLSMFIEESIYGAYIYEFMQPSALYSANPKYDLDMASFGIVRVIESSDEQGIAWQPKRAFKTVASIFERAEIDNIDRLIKK